MTVLASISASVLLTLQAAPPAPDSPDAAAPTITDLSQLPIEQAAAPRCGVAFAIMEGIQQAGDERAKQWPDIETSGGREFFVQAVGKLMADNGLDEQSVLNLVEREVARLSSDNYERAHEMMPPCLLMLEASGL